MMIWSKSEAGQAPVTVTVTDQPMLMADIRDRFARAVGFSVATLNLDHVVKLTQDPVFYAAYADHTHVTADGNPIVWLSRLARQKIDLIPGSELIDPVAALAAEMKVPVALFGATDASLTAAARALQERYADINVVLTLSPAMGFDPEGADADAAIAKLETSGARLVFLALGAPKQEVFAARAQKVLKQSGFLSIGAGLDFISGQQVRAPKWVRKLAAEWLWRMLSNPKRLAKRYGACLLMLPRLTVRAALARRQTGQS